MSDIFQEVDEEVRREQLKSSGRYGNYSWWRPSSVVAGVAAWRGYSWWAPRRPPKPVPRSKRRARSPRAASTARPRRPLPRFVGWHVRVYHLGARARGRGACPGHPRPRLRPTTRSQPMISRPALSGSCGIAGRGTSDRRRLLRRGAALARAARRQRIAPSVTPRGNFSRSPLWARRRRGGGRRGPT